VKASYTRSFEGAPTGGGRVTELVARPLVSLLFPKLADIGQPLGGEYAARRDALEVLPFVEGWGVELGLLVDIVDRYGRDAVAQVDLGTREHRNRPVDELAAQSLAIIATALQRAELMRFDEPALELLRYDRAGNLEAEQVEIRERPPIKTIAAYRALHH
jgi:glucosyl-3-phosphoglycerate synthase